MWSQRYINRLDETEEIENPSQVRTMPLPVSYWPEAVDETCYEWGTGWTLFALVGDCWVPVKVIGFK